MPVGLLVVLSLLSVLPLTASQSTRTGTPPPASPTPRPQRPEVRVPFKPGEALTYGVSWSNYLTAGTATMTVVDKKASFGSDAYYIVAETRPTGLLSKLYSLYYKADTLLDVYTLLPQRGSVYSEEGKRHRLRVTRFHPETRTAEFEVQTATVVKRELPLPLYAQDALSIVYAVRAMPLKAGDKVTIPVCDSGRNYKVEVTVGQPESVKTGLGGVNGWRITPVLLNEKGQVEGRRLTLWVSADARRLPLKLDVELAVGKFELLLREATGILPS